MPDRKNWDLGDARVNKNEEKSSKRIDKQQKTNHRQSTSDSKEKLLNDKHIVQNISGEEWREVETAHGIYRIVAPVTLITQPGGLTHQVVDSDGIVHCYVAPETGRSILRWKINNEVK
ncbi:MAG: hypothetical protein ACOC56_05690 [Atribacterota bacterium]